MGKIKPRLLGIEEVEEKQKKEQKTKAYEKKLEKKKTVKEEISKEKKAVKSKKSSDSEDKAKKQTVSKKSRGKKYLEAKKLVDRTKTYSLKEAVALLKKMNVGVEHARPVLKFDQSVELHLNVDKTGLRGEIEMPYSTGKTVIVKIVDDKILSDLGKGKIEFDILITHPSFMSKLAKFAKVLGPKGLMPNPKTGTVSLKPEEVAKKFEKGTLRWKTELKFPLIHQMIGKISNEDKALVGNAQAFLKSVGSVHIQKAVVKTTMSPGIKITVE